MTTVARRDPTLVARLGPGRPLQGVRSASGLCWFDGAFAVVQDDAIRLARLEPATGRITKFAFDAASPPARAAKAHKADHECACVLPDGRLLVLGSGSRPTRERLVLVTGAQGPALTRDAPDLYRNLRDCAAFAGSELNIEGAVWRDDTLVLFNRGNGAPRAGRTPVDACCELEGPALLAWLDDARATAPQPRAVQAFDLGRLGATRLTFTDAARRADGTLLYLAAAERSADAYQDGPVAGSALGVMDEAGLRWAPLTDADGAPSARKFEGLGRAPDGRWFVVDDPDDAAQDAQLYALELHGPW